MSIIKFHYDIARPKRRFKIRQNAKTSFGMNSIVRQCVQKWIELPQWLWLAKNENVFKKTLNDFLLSKHKKISLNSNVGAFKSYFYF